MMRNDESYYRSRATQEEAAARMATCPEARGRHEVLAAAYRFRCRVLETESISPRPLDTSLRREDLTASNSA